MSDQLTRQPSHGATYILRALLIVAATYSLNAVGSRVIAQSPTGGIKPKSIPSPSPRQPTQNATRVPATAPMSVQVSWVNLSIPVTASELSGSGTVVQREDMPALNEIPGRLEKLYAYVGENVKRGTLLGEMDCEPLRSEERQAAVALAKAEAQLNVLAPDSSKRPAALVLVRQRSADLQATRARLPLCKIKSPLEGTLAEILVSEGQILAAGQGLVTIKPLYPYRVRLDLTNIKRADSGSSRIVIPIGNEAAGSGYIPPTTAQGIGVTVSYKGMVDRVIYADDDLDRITGIEIDFQLKSATLGERISVTMKYSPPTEITVDPRAIITSGRTSRVFIVDNGVVFEQVVRTGATHDGVTEILAGLQGGEYVALNPKNLRSGQAVKVQK